MQLGGGSKQRWWLGGSLGMAAAVAAVLITFGVPQAAGGCGGASMPDEAGTGPSYTPQEGDEHWDAANDPAKFGQVLEYKLDALPMKGEAKTIPWTGSYWPVANDNINFRWDGNNDSPAAKYSKAFKVAGVEDAVSKSNGVDGQIASGAKACTSNSQCSSDNGEICARRQGKTSGACIPTWFGICHGWTPASILFPEPKHAVVKNGVTFKVMDLKALASFVMTETDTKFVSLRCDTTNRANGMNFDKYKRPSDAACRDPGSPGTMHVLMSNFLGKLGRAFAEDRTMDAEVWNQPIRGYRILEKREVSAQDANKLIGVKADPGPSVQKTGTVTKGQWGHQDPVAVVGGTAWKASISGSGDADLYVQFDAQPTAAKYACRPFKNGSTESCSGTVPATATKMFVSVFGKGDTSGFTLKFSTGGAISTTYQFERNPAPVKFAYIKAEMDYISESSPDADGYITPHINDFTSTDSYEYILELDKDGKITGGEWVGSSKEVHPDFFWLPLKASAASVSNIKYADVKALMDASIK